MRRLFGMFALFAALALVIGGCGSTEDESQSPTSVAAKKGDPSKPDPRTKGWDIHGYPINGGPKGADGSTGNNLDRHFCSHNQDPRCPTGSYVGPFTGYHDNHGYWDAQGRPVRGGPVGANGSTHNNLTQEYCARNESPACPRGSYVGPNAQRDPRGGPHYVKCEGTICTNPNHGAGTDPRENGEKCEGTACTNPNHGAGTDPRENGGDNSATGVWDANGNPVAGGPTGADGSTGNNRTRQYCATNQDPGCPAGSFVHQDGPPEPAQNQGGDDQGNNDQDDTDQDDSNQGGDDQGNNDQDDTDQDDSNQGGDDQGNNDQDDTDQDDSNQGGDDQGGNDQDDTDQGNDDN